MPAGRTPVGAANASGVQAPLLAPVAQQSFVHQHAHLDVATESAETMFPEPSMTELVVRAAQVGALLSQLENRCMYSMLCCRATSFDTGLRL